MVLRNMHFLMTSISLRWCIMIFSVFGNSHTCACVCLTCKFQHSFMTKYTKFNHMIRGDSIWISSSEISNCELYLLFHLYFSASSKNKNWTLTLCQIWSWAWHSMSCGIRLSQKRCGGEIQIYFHLVATLI